MTIAPASEANVEFALGRLATVGGNLDLARGHADARDRARAGALRPATSSRPMPRTKPATTESLVPALESAVEHGSRESWIYATKADRLLMNSQRDSGRLDELLPADTARAAADLYERALGLRPRNAAAFAGLIMALLNVATLTDADNAAVNAGRMMFPTDGLLLVGEAAAAKSRGDIPTAVQLLGRATAEPFTMPRRYRNSVVALRSSWFGEWFLAELGDVDGRTGVSPSRTRW